MDASPFLDLISQHTVLACIGITLISFLECLALVGLLLPGTVLIFFFGTLAGSGILPVVAVLGCTFLGAFLGDLCSYWLGRLFHQEIKALPLFRNQGVLFQRGEDFFQRHGGKGLFLGRFIGPLRPVVPLVAGMMDMSGPRFIIIGLCSCMIWTVVYLLPGMFFGSSLAVVAQISGRLTVVILLCTTILLSTGWVFRQTARTLEMLGHFWIINVGWWLNTRPASKKISHALRHFVLPTIRPYREQEGLGAFLVVFSLCMFALFVLAFHPGTDWHKALSNTSLAHFFHSLQTFWTLHALIFLSALGRNGIIFSVTGVLILFLALSRHLHIAAYLTTAIVGAQFLAFGMQGGPQGVLPWANQVFDPSTIIIDPALWPPVYAFPAILLSTRFRYAPWWVVFWAVFSLTCLIGAADLWLGRWTLPQIVYGMSLGWGWTSVLGFAYLQNSKQDFPILPSLVIWLGALLMIFPWQVRQIQLAYPQALIQNRPAMSLDVWRNEGWRELSVYREDMQGQPKQPLNIQFYGHASKLLQRLSHSGWDPVPDLSVRRMLAHFSPDSSIHDLLVLPSLHKGYPETIRMQKNNKDGRLILRLWQAGVRKEDREKNLWVGRVSRQVRREYLGLFSLAVEELTYPSGVDKVTGALGPNYIAEYKQRQERRGTDWNGRVLLVYAKPRPEEFTKGARDRALPARAAD
ncbi:MAG: VTT domain-containing protein [Desulfovermiculus sp.]|nr:VTT domain-containing protein [Desulfovermiculus sp.]